MFCEKPPGRDVEDIAARPRGRGEAPGQKLKYGFNHRYHDSVRDALRIIRAGELGGWSSTCSGVYGKSKMITFDSRLADEARARRRRDPARPGDPHGRHDAAVRGRVRSTCTRYVSNDVLEPRRRGQRLRADADRRTASWRCCTRRRPSGGTASGSSITLSEGALHPLGHPARRRRSYGAETITIVSRAQRRRPRRSAARVTTRYNRDNSWRDEIDEFAQATSPTNAIRHGSSLEALKTMQLVYEIYCADPAWAARFDLDVQPLGDTHEQHRAHLTSEPATAAELRATATSSYLARGPRRGSTTTRSRSSSRVLRDRPHREPHRVLHAATADRAATASHFQNDLTRWRDEPMRVVEPDRQRRGASAPSPTTTATTHIFVHAAGERCCDRRTSSWRSRRPATHRTSSRRSSARNEHDAIERGADRLRRRAAGRLAHVHVHVPTDQGEYGRPRTCTWSIDHLVMSYLWEEVRRSRPRRGAQ